MDEGEEDVWLEEFMEDEDGNGIEPWIIDKLKAIGCDTAKSVLDLSVDELVRRSKLEKETIMEVLDILREEFE